MSIFDQTSLGCVSGCVDRTHLCIKVNTKPSQIDISIFIVAPCPCDLCSNGQRRLITIQTSKRTPGHGSDTKVDRSTLTLPSWTVRTTDPRSFQAPYARMSSRRARLFVGGSRRQPEQARSLEHAPFAPVLRQLSPPRFSIPHPTRPEPNDVAPCGWFLTDPSIRSHRHLARSIGVDGRRQAFGASGRRSDLPPHLSIRDLNSRPQKSNPRQSTAMGRRPLSAAAAAATGGLLVLSSATHAGAVCPPRPAAAAPSAFAPTLTPSWAAAPDSSSSRCGPRFLGGSSGSSDRGCIGGWFSLSGRRRPRGAGVVMLESGSDSGSGAGGLRRRPLPPLLPTSRMATEKKEGEGNGVAPLSRWRAPERGEGVRRYATSLSDPQVSDESPRFDYNVAAAGRLTDPSI